MVFMLDYSELYVGTNTGSDKTMLTDFGDWAYGWVNE
jgi:hypothetical protein